MSTVTFVSKCWGGDYKDMIAFGFAKKKESCEYNFDRELLVLNNGVPTHYSDMENVVWVSQPTGDTNFYFRGEYSGMKHVKTDYVCYVQGDCITTGGDWITPAIEVLENEPGVMIVSPGSEVNTWHDNEGYDHYMSDQAFVARAPDMWKQETWLLKPQYDPDYPNYAKGSFEARVGAYLKVSGLKRKILPKFWVHHG